MKRKYIYIIIFIILIILVILLKFKSNNKLVGTWQLESENSINYHFYSNGKFEAGNKKDLKCDLWNCIGYSNGTYKIKNKELTLYYDSYHVTLKYEIKNENNETYLIIEENTSKGYKSKYKKI